MYGEREARRGAIIVVSGQLYRLHDFIKPFCFSLHSSVIGDRESESCINKLFSIEVTTNTNR